MKTLSLLLFSLLYTSVSWGIATLQVAPAVLTQATEVTLADIASINIKNTNLENRIGKIILAKFSNQETVKVLNGDVIKIRLDLAGLNNFNLKIIIPQSVTLVRSSAQLESVLNAQKVTSISDPGLVVKDYKDPVVKKPMSKKVQKRFALKGVMRGVMLKSSVSAGDIITAKDLVYINFRRARTGVIGSFNDVVGKRALRGLRHKTIMTVDMIGSFDVVQGEGVRVQAKRKGFVIETVAKAAQSGVAGEVITVFNPRTRKNFSAKIAGPGLVEVIF